jgi:hypothetical protein
VIDRFRILPRQAAETLADWVLTFGPESPCFCCGAPFFTQDVGVDPRRSEAHLLRCPRCGAEVFCGGAAELPAAPFETPRTGQRVLAAA